jgi:hypothetical protein
MDSAKFRLAGVLVSPCLIFVIVGRLLRSAHTPVVELSSSNWNRRLEVDDWKWRWSYCWKWRLEVELELDELGKS